MQDYWLLFEKFCRAEMATGGPDPQIDTILRLMHVSGNHKLATDVDRIWMAGCYAAHHCVGSAFTVYTRWSPFSFMAQSNASMKWLQENWDYLPVRPEMRSHRMLEKRHECLSDFAHYAFNRSWNSIDDFELLWDHSIGMVKYFGRYMAIKFMEIGNRADVFKPKMPDMRARGAWSPRRALAMLYPNDPLLGDREDTTEQGHQLMEHYASMSIKRLAKIGLSVNFFQLQVMLCEFREALDGTYYPGASLDEELEYLAITHEKFDMSPVYQARRFLFKTEHLGEFGGWNGTRKEKYREFK